MESKNEANFARYATMLIDLGSATVRNLFNGLVLKKYRVQPAEMDKLFRKPDVLDMMQRKKHLFIPEVFQNITKNKNWYTSMKYDLTDLILLISVLELVPEAATGWRHQPSDSDSSDGAQLVRLRKLRNDCYAHLTSTSTLLYESSYKSLQSVLLSLGAEKKEVDNYNVKFQMHELSKLLSDQMKKDLDEIRLIHSALEELTTNQDENFRLLIEKLKEIDYNHKAYSEKVLEALQLNSLDQKLSILVKDNARIREQLNAAVVVKPVVDRQIQPHLETIKNVLSEKQAVFRILVKTSVRQVGEAEDPFHQSSIDDLAKAIGLCDWNVVIDLEYETKTTMEFRLALIKSMGREPEVITYEKLENVKDYFPHVASNKKSLWILANGGQDTPQCLSNFARTEMKIRDLLHGIIRTMEKKPVQSFLLAMSDASEEELDAVSEVANGIKSALDSWEDNISAENSYQFCVIFEDVAAKWLDGAIKDCQLYSITKKRKRPEPLKATAPITQISALFTSAFPSKNHEESYYIPGDAGESAISLRELNLFSLDMTIYHRDIGILSDPKQNEQIKSSFVKGATITPEVLRLQKTDPPVYVVRKEMKDWIKTIEDMLKRRREKDYTSKTNSICFLRHPPSAGGSTCARHFLFKLRKKFPCIHVRSYSEKLLPNLVEISRRAKLPLFLVLERIDFENRTAVQTLQEQLREKWVRFLVLFVEQRTGKPVLSNSECFQLNAKVCTEDQENYEKIYKESKKWKGCGGKSNFQFGILSCKGDYIRIEKHVTDCTSEKSASDRQLRILRALCFFSKYAPTKRVQRPLILRYLESREDYNEEALSDKLGNLDDFVVTEVDADGFFVCKITVDCLIEPLLKRCRQRLLSNETARNEMVDFLDDLKELVKLDFSVDKSDTAKLVRGIFIDRNQSEEQDSSSENGEAPLRHEKQHFATFVLDLEKKCGADRVSDLISSIADLFPSTGSGAHFRALRARYLMYELKKEEDAIQEIKRAIGLKAQSIEGNQVISDAHLLVLYGQLVMKKANGTFDSCKSSEVNEELREFQVAVKEAVEAFSMAQKIKVSRPGYPKGQYNSYSFIEEAKSRYSLLDKHLRKKHNSDPRELYKSLAKNKKNTFLRTSYYAAMQALQTLDYYCEASLVYDHDAKDTESRMNRIKWNLQKLVIDRDKGLSVFEKEIPVKQPFDIGWYVLQPKDESKQKMRFVDLKLSDLKSIHAWIEKRINEGGAILRNNYRDFIMSMICIRRHDPSLTNLNTASAIECANRWIKDCQWDFEAYFMRGALRLVQAMDEENGKDTKLYLAATKDFSDARKVVEDNDVRIKKWSRKFNIGVGKGLERLIPTELRDTTTKLQEFDGCIVGESEVSVYSTGGSHAFNARLFPHDESVMSYARPQVKFHLFLRYAGILADDLKL